MLGAWCRETTCNTSHKFTRLKAGIEDKKTEVETIWKTIVERKKGDSLGKIVLGKYDNRCLDYVYFGWLF